jgi:two-component system, cell cycle response regulator DivK
MLRILLVDDNRDIRQLLQLSIRRMGLTPIIASNGKEDIERAMVDKPDLILMDFMMPTMDGWEATQTLRARPETKDIPILAMTGLNQKNDLERCISVGCNDYIVKPFPVDELRGKIKALIPMSNV